MIRVTVYLGIGSWKVTKTVTLIACPHVDDVIDVDGVGVTCEQVCIFSDRVQVEQLERFQSPTDMDEYTAMG